ncbi:hypothetical protein P7C70_g8486, partial [Phenoliferia sp. Uapishka_3]
MSVSRFSIDESTVGQPDHILIKILTPRLWPKRRPTPQPPAMLDFKFPPAPPPKKGLARWFRTSELELAPKPNRKMSAPARLEQVEEGYHSDELPPLPRSQSAMALTSPLPNFIYPAPPPLSPLPTSFPTTPSLSEYGFVNRSRRKSGSMSSIPGWNPPTRPTHQHTNSDSSNSVSAGSMYFPHHRRGTPNSSTSSSSSFATSVGSSGSVPLSTFLRGTPGRITADVQAAFDSATFNLSKALDLPLVYLVSLDLSNSTPLPSLNLLSSVGLSPTSPSLSPSLHFQALRAAEGGLLYRAREGTKPLFAAGILIPVMEVRRVGYLLCAYTKNGERELESRDVKYVMRFAEELECWVAKVGKNLEDYARLAECEQLRYQKRLWLSADRTQLPSSSSQMSFSLLSPPHQFLREILDDHREALRCLPQRGDTAVLSLQGNSVLWIRASSSYKPLTFTFRNPTRAEFDAYVKELCYTSSMSSEHSRCFLAYRISPAYGGREWSVSTVLERTFNGLQDEPEVDKLELPLRRVDAAVDAFNSCGVLFQEIYDRTRHEMTGTVNKSPNVVSWDCNDAYIKARRHELEEEKRNEYELQALVLFTLVEHKAEEELIALAMERAAAIVRTDQGNAGFSASVMSMMDLIRKRKLGIPSGR